ncbi:MAG: hypothetical protein D3914_12270 [Candidatus Electrothrix sp. LOE2]|nr:hypothetical protein [Candidatus Electrothrix sp. LOE2]
MPRNFPYAATAALKHNISVKICQPVRIILLYLILAGFIRRCPDEIKILTGHTGHYKAVAPRSFSGMRKRKSGIVNRTNIFMA